MSQLRSMDIPVQLFHLAVSGAWQQAGAVEREIGIIIVCDLSLQVQSNLFTTMLR